MAAAEEPKGEQREDEGGALHEGVGLIKPDFFTEARVDYTLEAHGGAGDNAENYG